MCNLKTVSGLSTLPDELFQIIYKLVMEETLQIIESIEAYDIVNEDGTTKRVFWWLHCNRNWGSLKFVHDYTS